MKKTFKKICTINKKYISLVKTENIPEIKMYKLVKIGGNKLVGKLMKIQKYTVFINVRKHKSFNCKCSI